MSAIMFCSGGQSMKTSLVSNSLVPAFLGSVLFGALIITPTFAPAADSNVHEGHEVATPPGVAVQQPAGPVLQEKMARAIEQIEKQVKSKGPFQGAAGHAMQQGVLLVAEDLDKVKVTQGVRCPANAPVRAFDITAINVEITLNRFGDFFP